MSDESYDHKDDGKRSAESLNDSDGGEVGKIYSTTVVADPFGDESNSEVKYKVLRWWYVPCRSSGESILMCFQASGIPYVWIRCSRSEVLIPRLVMIAEIISLGILSLPSGLGTLGFAG